MRGKSFCRKFIPFVLSFLVGLMAVIIPQKLISLNNEQVIEKKENKEHSKTKNIYSKQGSGSSGRSYGHQFSENKIQTPSETATPNNKKLQILYKPLAHYTDEARVNNIQGAVILRVVFLGNGTIGNISVIEPLPHGLTEKAIEAAKKIRFEPEIKNEKPVVVAKKIQFTFTIY